VAPVKSAV
jgi:Protein of unknown function (DUF2439)